MQFQLFAASLLLLGTAAAESIVTEFASCESSAALTEVDALQAAATSTPALKAAAVEETETQSEATTVVVYSTVTVVPQPLNTSAAIVNVTNVPSQTCFLTTISGSPRGVCQPNTGYVPLPTGTGKFHNYTAVGTGRYNRTKTTLGTGYRGSGYPSGTGTAISYSAALTSSSSSTEIDASKPSFTQSHGGSPSHPTTTSSSVPTSFATSTKSSSIVSSSTSSTSSSASATSTSSNSSSDFLYGVNLGGWLVLEEWMNSDIFVGDFADATDEWSFSEIDGAEEALQEHWETFFTEDDIQTIAATGINALRIPIGYWAYNNTGTPYFQGADAYLEKAIGWARNAGMKVWVDCHGSPGSQNGFDNSGHAGDVDWQSDENLALSIDILTTMASKYGANEYADVVVGLELTNEPISYGNNVFSVTQSWAASAHAAVTSVIENQNLVIVMHDAFEGSSSWTSIADSLNILGLSSSNLFGIDSHLYQLYTDTYNSYTQAEHIEAACAWADDLAPQNEIFPVYVGEFSAATNICVNPDGSTTAGTSCSTDGCQCQSADFDDWNDQLKKQVRMFVEAQLDVFESSSSGYFMWAAKGPGGWGFLNGIDAGIIPNPVTSREYSSQCGDSTRRRR